MRKAPIFIAWHPLVGWDLESVGPTAYHCRRRIIEWRDPHISKDDGRWEVVQLNIAEILSVNQLNKGKK